MKKLVEVPMISANKTLRYSALFAVNIAFKKEWSIGMMEEWSAPKIPVTNYNLPVTRRFCG